MSQLNIHLTAALQDDLSRLVRLRGLRSKSEAVRIAVKEALERESRKRRSTDFSEWLGLGLRAPLARRPRFGSDDDLWG